MTGYTDIEENVLEFFKENEIVGSIFVNTDTIGKHGFMDIESLKKIDKYISVYSHGKEHINYGREYTNNNISKEKVLEYAKQPIDYLSENISKRPYIFCYPYGGMTLEIDEYLREKGVYTVHTDNLVNMEKDLLKENRCHREYMLNQCYFKTYVKKIYRAFRYYGYTDKI